MHGLGLGVSGAERVGMAWRSGEAVGMMWVRRVGCAQASEEATPDRLGVTRVEADVLRCCCHRIQRGSGKL